MHDLPRLIATDLDGTLVGTDGSISPRTAEVLAELDRRDVPVVFVTGRPLRWAREVFAHVGTHGLAIISNGALVWDVAADRAVLTRAIEPALGIEAAEALRAAVPGTSFGVEDVEGVGLETDYVERYPMPPGTRRGALREIFTRPALKILARHEDLEPDAFHQAAHAAIGSRLVATRSSATSLVEISGPGVTKASTLALICAERGIGQQEVIAFGDMPNDLPMLEWAGTSYAMADAHPSLLAIADHIAPGHDEDGVARVLAGVFDL